MWRIAIGAIGLLLVGGAGSASAAPQSPEPPTDDAVLVEEGTVTGGDSTEGTPVTLPLVPVPSGCAAPPSPYIVFVGEVVDRDVRTIRYRIESIRYGRPDPFAGGDRIDVRYGLDAQYLADGDRYLVSAVVDPDLGVLASRVTEPIEHFGGDEVIGVSESDVACPAFEDPNRTLHLDGTPVEGSVLAPFFDAKIRILGAILLPAGLAVAAIFLLASFRLSLAGLYRSVTGTRQRAA